MYVIILSNYNFYIYVNIQTYTLNEYSLLYINYTSTNMITIKSKRLHIFQTSAGEKVPQEKNSQSKRKQEKEKNVEMKQMIIQNKIS